MKKTPPSQRTAIDLFCGCGGFALGLLRAGIKVLAAIDFDPKAVETCRSNLGEGRVPKGLAASLGGGIAHVLEEDLTSFDPATLAELIGTDRVDIIVGGPPCQGFSNARQRDGANHGTRRLVEDSRRQLYQDYLRFIDYFQPRLFIMENVLGIRKAAGGEYYDRVWRESRELGQDSGKPGYRVLSKIEDVYPLGVPQKRRRQLFIGVRADLPGYFRDETKPAPRAWAYTNLGPSIMDLPRVPPGGGANRMEYDLERRRKAYARDATVLHYLQGVYEVQHAQLLANHTARPHSDRDLRDFLLLKEGQTSADAMKSGVEFEFPYDKSSFADRYTRQSRFTPCSTIVAHLAKDGLMFIHPRQNRSFTPREAARVQTFPDWFVFPSARTHSFRMIGNAVPPLVSEAVGIEAREFLDRAEAWERAAHAEGLPASEIEAAERIVPLLDMTRHALCKLDNDRFLDAWRSIAFLFQGLHPDESDHGPDIEDGPVDSYLDGKIDERIIRPWHARTGWPVALVPLLREARRRHAKGLIADEDLYAVDAQRAGMLWRQGEELDLGEASP